MGKSIRRENNPKMNSIMEWLAKKRRSWELVSVTFVRLIVHGARSGEILTYPLIELKGKFGWVNVFNPESRNHHH